MHPQRLLVALSLALLSAGAASAQNGFVNYETPHVHPLEISPDGAWLLAVNTADDRLEVFDLAGGLPAPAFDVPVGIDPVSVRARTASEVWVVNHVSDSVSVVDLATRRIVATLETDDEPADVVFAGVPQRAFVSCSQANTVLVFDPANLSAAPARIPILGEDPRAMAVSPNGRKVYVAVFESGNGSTVLGGGLDSSNGSLVFPPNVVSHPSGPYGGQNPPPNSGGSFDPPVANGTLPVGLIVRKDEQGRWMDDNGGDWSAFVDGASAPLSGRPTGWQLVDNDVAVIDAATLSVSYASGLMNLCMALAVNPATGEVAVVGTDGTNEVRFEPKVQGTFLRVQLALVGSGGARLDVVDMNPHLDYSTANVPQGVRELSIGDPRGIAWRSDGLRAYVSGMGSNNVVVVDSAGARAGFAPTIEVGEGPTGVALDEARGLLYVLAKFEGAVSVVNTASELEVARIPFFDPEPAAIKLGRKHLYGTHETSGLGQVACASCHVDARWDRLAWDLGDPPGDMKPVAGQNRGMGIPGLTGGFQPFHPMKGPMTTQPLVDIIGHEPLHWRGDRDGLEEFNGAFVGLQGKDAGLSPVEMQQFEDLLATIHFPPNPYRNFDNTLPTSLPLDGHFTTGRFGPAGQPLPNGNAVRGLNIYRPPRRLDAGVFACSTCHTLPTGAGSDTTWNGAQFVPFPVGPNGERHHGLVSVDGTTNRSMKIPQLRSLYEKRGFNTTQLVNTAGFGVLHDGSVDSIERFVAEPVFTIASNQEVADLVAFMLAFSGSDLPQATGTFLLEPPGTPSQDSHAAVGAQTTLVSAASAPPAQAALLADMLALASSDAAGLVVKGRQGGLQRGYVYDRASGLFLSDRAAETLTPAQLQAAAAPASELTYTVVNKGTEVRIGIDRDSDGYYDRDELDAGTDPANPGSHPGGCTLLVPAAPSDLSAVALGATQINLSWSDRSANETGFQIDRAPAGTQDWTPLATVGAGVTNWPDTGLACDDAFHYRVSAFNCAGPSGFSLANGATAPCCAAPFLYCTAAPNSVGAGAHMGASGVPSLSQSQFHLTATGAPANKFALFFYGPNQVQVPFGDGFLCVGGGIYRLGPAQLTDGGGDASRHLDFNGPPAHVGQITAGSTWNFQMMYRDPQGPGGSGLNATDGLSVTFCP